jgi:hypothetical protein
LKKKNFSWGSFVKKIGRFIKKEEGDGPKNKREDDPGLSESPEDVKIGF